MSTNIHIQQRPDLLTTYNAIRLFTRKHFPEISEDVIQNIAVKLLRNPASLPARLSYTWLLTVISNARLDEYREQRRRRRLIDDDLVLNHNGSVSSTEEPTRIHWPACHHSLRQEFNRDPDIAAILTTAFARLSRTHRQTLSLHLEGSSYIEIAATTGTTIGTVRSRLHYARKFLHDAIAAYHKSV